MSGPAGDLRRFGDRAAGEGMPDGELPQAVGCGGSPVGAQGRAAQAGSVQASGAAVDHDADGNVAREPRRSERSLPQAIEPDGRKPGFSTRENGAGCLWTTPIHERERARSEGNSHRTVEPDGGSLENSARKDDASDGLATRRRARAGARSESSSRRAAGRNGGDAGDRVGKPDASDLSAIRRGVRPGAKPGGGSLRIVERDGGGFQDTVCRVDARDAWTMRRAPAGVRSQASLLQAVGGRVGESGAGQARAVRSGAFASGVRHAAMPDVGSSACVLPGEASIASGIGAPPQSAPDDAAILDLVREDLRDFGGYASARRAGVSGSVWLNANESPWRNAADADGVNRYPEPQPAPLRAALAELYGVDAERVLIGRGSDEAIDLLVRALCRPGRDAVVIAPPVFGMYAVSARLQGAPLVEMPLLDSDAGWTCSLPLLASAAIARHARLVFVCSPANPTGQAVALNEIAALARALEGRAVVVVDEAYGDYSDVPSAATLLDAHRNLAVLRTLSKAHGLAAARIGTLLADPALIRVLRNCQAPYPLPDPCVRLALAALAPEALAQTRARVSLLLDERARVLAALQNASGVRRAYPSQGNYLLVRLDDAQGAFERLLAAGVVVRDMRASPGLDDALRLTIGTPAENDALLAALVIDRSAA